MSNNQLEGVAIIGMAGRFPGAQDVTEYWRNLRDGVEAIKFFTDDELKNAGVEAARLNHPNFIKAKGAIENGDQFDAAFFSFTPREAELMDPQHRVFMECVWTALENSGYNPDNYTGAIGLYGGESMNSYLLLNLMSNRELLDSVGLLQASVQNRTDHLTTHVAYKLNLKGPSLTVQTACSTSLVAVHQACQSLLGYECDIAVAGGVSVTVPLKNGYVYLDGGIYSPDGHCRAFDENAQGTVEGNGTGAVVLKRLADAIRDNDTIHAVIRGSAINNDGSLKVGYTAPGVSGQAEVITEALSVSGVEPETISYVETHGTGTALGDPVEIEALQQAFRQGTDAKRFCGIGSVKTNIGHLDAAAGVAGLIKTVLALENKQLPPSLNFERENPRIDFANTPFYVNAELAEWKTQNGTPRRAGVSSFGIGGTNAHVVVEEAPEQRAAETKRRWHLLPISARTTTALDTATFNLHGFLSENRAVDPADVAYTLQVGRKQFNHRRVVISRDMDDLVHSLETLDARRVFTSLQEPRERPVVFMFPGQGAQYAGMGRELYETESVFREEVDRCAEILKSQLGFDLRDVLYPADDQREAATQKISQTYITQPALFVTEYALAKQWMAWGVKPEAMIGHSIGEYVAACLAGVFALEDALRLVALRGRLIQDLPSGSMLVTSMPEAQIRSVLERHPELSLAANNAPALFTVAGPHEAIDKLEAELKTEQLMVRRLHTSHAFHSQMMEPILAPFTEAVAKTTRNAPSLPYISNVTGTWITDDEATDASYYTRHIRQTVQFSEGAGELFKNPQRALVEVGPGNTLSVLVRHHPQRGAAQMVLSSLPRVDEQEADEAVMLTTLGRLWLANVNVDWGELYADEARRRVPLPTYPFERQRYWIEAQANGNGSRTGKLQKNPEIAEWFYTPSWRRSDLAAKKAVLNERRRWLIFADEGGIGARLQQRLEAAGQEVITVSAGHEFSRTGNAAFTVNPGQREDYQSLLKEIGATNDTAQTIVHLWNVTSQEHDDVLSRSFYSPLYLVQALGDQLVTFAPTDDRAQEQLKICIVSNNLQEVTGEEKLNPEKATLLGPCRVINQEYRNITCRSIDVITPEVGSREMELLLDNIVSEATGADDSARVIAYRGRHRWVQDFEQFRIDATETSLRLKDHGVYLITGGMGGMGLEIAQYFAASVQARLVLVGRTALPAREEWNEWLKTHDEGEEVSQRILKVRAIEEAGGEVLIAAGDVANEEQMQNVLAQARSRFGEINGVVHAAGVAGGGIIQLKTAAMANNVLAPKVTGTRVLDRLLQDTPLDFFVMCSSRGSVLGGFGNVDYCAANAYLDAFAHYKRAQGEPYVSIDWDAWQSVGMLVKNAAKVAAKKAVTVKAHSNGNGNGNGNGHQAYVHPLLHRQIDAGANERAYETDFTVTEYWVLDDHRIVGTAVMPGTAYLEMARAAVEKETRPGTLEIRDAFFLAPLALRDDEKRQVRTIVEKDDDEFSYRIVSKPAATNGDAAEWQTFSIGKIAYVDSEPPVRHDLQSIIERCNSKEVIIRDDDEFDPDLGPRWQSLQRVRVGDGELIATLELPQMFDADMEHLKLHPALLDRATGTAKHFLVNEGHYLPMGYKRLQFKGPLPRKVHTYIRQKDSGSRNETITFDILLLDDDGVECVVIDSFSQKRVNDATGTIKLMAGGARKESATAKEEGIYQKKLASGITPEEGIEAFGRILSNDAPPQVIVSTKDLRASIEQANSFTEGELIQESEKSNVPRPAHPRPNLQSPYVAPRTEVEQRLANIWQQMLGIDQVSIHDNFFELGGDSVQAIQISVKINEAGLHFTPQQLFQNQTIAELAGILDTSPANGSTTTVETPAADQTGEFSLAGVSQDELAKIAMLIEAADELNDAVI